MSADPGKLRGCLWLALALVLAHGLWLGASLPDWHEEVSSHAGRPTQWLDISPAAPLDAPPILQPSCADADAPRLLRAPVRPVTALCLGGLAWPVLVSPYAAGVAYWPLQLLRPLHHGHPVALRWASLVLAFLSLWVLWRLALRYRDPATAAAAVLVAAVLSSFLHLHALLVVYEHVPTLLVLLAVLVLDADARPPTRRRLAAAGALAGLALASNIKALIVGGPLLALALWRSPRMRAPGLAGWSVFALALALVAGPFVALALTDPYAGVAGQVSQRGAALLANLDPRHLLAEIHNALIFFTDFGYYLDIAAGEPAPLPVVFLVLPALALARTSVALVRLLRRRETDAIAAGCGAVLWTFILFVALFYRQTPAANYGPIVHVHALALAVLLIDGGRALARRWPAKSRHVVAGVVALGLAVLAAAVHRHGDRRDHMPASIDLHALEQLTDWLRAHDDARVVVTTYNLVGVLDAMAASPAPTVTVHQLLRTCPQRDADCKVARLAAFLRTTDAPLHVVVPARVVPIDEKGAAELAEQVRAAAAASGRACTVARTVRTRPGVEVLTVLRVEPRAAAGR